MAREGGITTGTATEATEAEATGMALPSAACRATVSMRAWLPEACTPWPLWDRAPTDRFSTCGFRKARRSSLAPWTAAPGGSFECRATIINRGLQTLALDV